MIWENFKSYGKISKKFEKILQEEILKKMHKISENFRKSFPLVTLIILQSQFYFLLNNLFNFYFIKVNNVEVKKLLWLHMHDTISGHINTFHVEQYYISKWWREEWPSSTSSTSLWSSLNELRLKSLLDKLVRVVTWCIDIYAVLALYYV